MSPKNPSTAPRQEKTNPNLDPLFYKGDIGQNGQETLQENKLRNSVISALEKAKRILSKDAYIKHEQALNEILFRADTEVSIIISRAQKQLEILKYENDITELLKEEKPEKSKLLRIFSRFPTDNKLVKEIAYHIALNPELKYNFIRIWSGNIGFREDFAKQFPSQNNILSAFYWKISLDTWVMAVTSKDEAKKLAWNDSLKLEKNAKEKALVIEQEKKRLILAESVKEVSTRLLNELSKSVVTRNIETITRLRWELMRSVWPNAEFQKILPSLSPEMQEKFNAIVIVANRIALQKYYGEHSKWKDLVSRELLIALGDDEELKLLRESLSIAVTQWRTTIIAFTKKSGNELRSAEEFVKFNWEGGVQNVNSRGFAEHLIALNNSNKLTDSEFLKLLDTPNGTKTLNGFIQNWKSKDDDRKIKVDQNTNWAVLYLSREFGAKGIEIGNKFWKILLSVEAYVKTSGNIKLAEHLRFEGMTEEKIKESLEIFNSNPSIESFILLSSKGTNVDNKNKSAHVKDIEFKIKLALTHAREFGITPDTQISKLGINPWNLTPEECKTLEKLFNMWRIGAISLSDIDFLINIVKNKNTTSNPRILKGILKYKEVIDWEVNKAESLSTSTRESNEAWMKHTKIVSDKKASGTFTAEWANSNIKELANELRKNNKQSIEKEIIRQKLNTKIDSYEIEKAEILRANWKETEKSNRILSGKIDDSTYYAAYLTEDERENILYEIKQVRFSQTQEYSSGWKNSQESLRENSIIWSNNFISPPLHYNTEAIYTGSTSSILNSLPVNTPSSFGSYTITKNESGGITLVQGDARPIIVDPKQSAAAIILAKTGMELGLEGFGSVIRQMLPLIGRDDWLAKTRDGSSVHEETQIIARLGQTLGLDVTGDMSNPAAVMARLDIARRSLPHTPSYTWLAQSNGLAGVNGLIDTSAFITAFLKTGNTHNIAVATPEKTIPQLA